MNTTACKLNSPNTRPAAGWAGVDTSIPTSACRLGSPMAGKIVPAEGAPRVLSRRTLGERPIAMHCSRGWRSLPAPGPLRWLAWPWACFGRMRGPVIVITLDPRRAVSTAGLSPRVLSGRTLGTHVGHSEVAVAPGYRASS